MIYDVLIVGFVKVPRGQMGPGEGGGGAGCYG